MGYSIKKNEILVHATTWVNSEHMPSDRSQSKDHILYGSIHKICTRDKSTKSASRLSVARALRIFGGKRKWLLTTMKGNKMSHT